MYFVLQRKHDKFLEREECLSISIQLHSLKSKTKTETQRLPSTYDSFCPNSVYKDLNAAQMYYCSISMEEYIDNSHKIKSLA